SGKKVENVMKAVAAGLPELAKNFSWVGDIFKQIGELSSTALGKFGEFVNGIKTGLSGLIEYITKVWSGKATNGDDYLLAQLGFDYDTIWKLEDFVTQFKEKAETFGEYISGFWKLFSSDEATSLDGYSMLTTLGMTQDQITGLETAVENVKKFLSDLKDVVLDLADVALYNLNQEFDTLYKFFTEDVGPYVLPIMQSWSDSFERMSDVFKDTGDSANGFKTAIVVAWKILEDRFKGLWIIVKTIMIAIQITIETVTVAIAGILNTFGFLITGQWGKAWEEIKKTGERIWAAIWGGIKDTFLGKILTSLGNFFDKNK